MNKSQELISMLEYDMDICDVICLEGTIHEWNDENGEYVSTDEECTDEIAEDQDDNVDEAKKVIKIRGGKRTKVVVCPNGKKAKGDKCVTMKADERNRRKKGRKKAKVAMKKSSKKATIARKKTMKKFY